ncbi:MAG: DUF2490 domain-containing protein [Chitinophagaceae bacterium]
MYRTGLLIFLLGMTTTTIAQPKGGSMWVTAQLPVDFSKRLQWHNDLSYKSGGITLKAYQRFYRTGLRYRISDHWNTAAGVGFFTTQTAGNKEDDEFGREFRVWEELIYQTSISKKWSFQNRLRPEERFLHATTQKPASKILNLSDRVSFTKELSEKWDLQMADEFFEQVIDKEFVFNQNRLMGAGIYTINNSLQIQGGYIWVLRKTFSQHVLQITIRKIFSAYGRHDHSSE